MLLALAINPFLKIATLAIPVNAKARAPAAVSVKSFVY
jgi:hypothetical protein